MLFLLLVSKVVAAAFGYCLLSVTGSALSDVFDLHTLGLRNTSLGQHPTHDSAPEHQNHEWYLHATKDACSVLACCLLTARHVQDATDLHSACGRLGTHCKVDHKNHTTDAHTKLVAASTPT